VRSGSLSRIIRLFVISAAIPVLSQGRVFACAGLSSETSPSENFITAERAIIIWDEIHKVEHFIRQASILTQSPDIGFLVPTPQMPDLAEVSPNIFDMAASHGQGTRSAPIDYRSPWTLISPLVTSSFLHLDRFSPATLLSGIGEL
jgi:hypothetical protein